MDLGLNTFVLVCMCVASIEDNIDKRLVLHSDVDIVQEILTIKADIAKKDQDISELKQNVTTLQSELELQKRNNRGLGSTYVRWGRTTCDGNDTELVYSGYAAGRHYAESGNAANLLCLPEHPKWAKYVEGVQDKVGHIHGSEFDVAMRNTFNPFNFPPNNYDNAQCAVCRTPYATTIMIPAMTDCYPGWHLQYTGYLMSCIPLRVPNTLVSTTIRKPS